MRDKSKHRSNHDSFFKQSLAIPEVAREVIEMHLPETIRNKVDLNSLKQIPETFVEKSLQKQIVDVLFSCSTKENKETVFIYFLCEHQRTEDYWMAMRLLKYMLAICDRFRRENPDVKKLPLIYPLVFYNGIHPHNAPRHFYELFEFPEVAKSILEGPFALDDLTQIEDEKLKENMWGGTLLFFMKYVDIRNRLVDLVKEKRLTLKQIHASKNGEDFLYAILCYNGVEELEIGEQQNLLELLVDITDKETADNLMGTLAQKWFEEGIQKGEQKGRQEASKKFVCNMLKAGMDFDQISRITGLSVAEVKELGKADKK
ncbi:Putative transposase [Candidatus Phycorickettsia trachydisci]|uniref:Transposase n=1 Tax=Candidatus Phycorickettsia trachydisci TaxID=2115978 RepID=A0A2P1P9K3_9RICK|nr:Rpn family recombination-promoting nuclease/putative transposase [Candidatus Phycorickettsia trachydisci]AVP87953.1 Putative transposase [Candidatus Phycorickettsia trachydisci]